MNSCPVCGNPLGRSNEKVLPSSPNTFYRGIQDIKRTYEGKKVRGTYQYKGWRLIL